jgi:hypothetical protein
MNVTSVQLMEAGGLCLEGKCPHAVMKRHGESSVTVEEVEAVLKTLIDELRPSRVAEFEVFAARHGIGREAVEELIAWQCDGVSPLCTSR